MTDDSPDRPARSLDTVAVHAGRDAVEGAVTFPIFQSATFHSRASDTSYDAVRYARLSNTPSHDQLHEKLAAICGAEAALTASSGMAAIAATLLTLLEAGDHALVQRGVYGGTHAFATRELARLGVAVTLVDGADPASWEAARRPETKVFYAEAITNPLVEVTDLAAVVAFARRHGLKTVVDATFATPVNLRPLALGVDVEVHSATKYLAGHSDVIAGVAAGARDLVRAITARQNHFGGSLDPHACFLVERGLKTLALRVRRQNDNARALAEALAAHPAVRRVHYPGVGADNAVPTAMRAAYEGGGFGGVLSAEIAGGGEAAERLIATLELVTHAPSLGGVETLITRPATTTHVGLPRAEREALGVGDGLVRIACGIEGTADLVADVRQAADRATSPR
ncbi:MAG: aminotransferase class I/II-fold pyridoxal phosphate-dependent enzyme [Myxococcales bacterium]|nr:aminotransferase class I/II-fold pyridoxal phosphate-dependent enzyme [Myxococcales bacterium]MCB9731715.1 aminotransferase class I/II-fold pyridoxal phosphate-dependent enzyme [Deltaproteobacteria bacterium]